MSELIFGVGVPISAASDEDPLGVAQQAERLGFDFVSAADHPCGPRPSYETTALLTWIAARTSRIKVASRVLGVPFRNPAMIAKLAASLDLLSGGRFILGLGAGYSDEEITAVGGRTLPPAGKVDALAEAVQVIRGAWTQPGFTQHGRYHSADGLKMSPRPAGIPVWLGTFGPRALAVTGRLADGWIPSLGYMPVEAIPAMRRRIDAAAEEAGRTPDEIRGILNLGIRVDPHAQPLPDAVAGSASAVVGQLRDLLGLGFSGFNFLPSGRDRMTSMRRIAEDVLPALRATG
jgi:alkanesulfonate monooxygenase SsuD/methylene tetrahydromethanopterin reductase-like flavin-dependent oxidoreductase (luciferase family)